VDLNVAQSMRGYIPFEVTHHKAPWCRREQPWPAPAWPMPDEQAQRPWDRKRLEEEVYQPWRDLQARGVGVHCGELGVYNQTPPHVAYAFLDDLLSIFAANGWGWALWNLRGPFGVLDTGREGTKTEPLDDHLLDRTMLELLKRHLPPPP
jgi:endoglucanase